MGSFVGLMFRMGADTSTASQQVEEFAKHSGKSVGEVEAQIRDYNRSMTAAYDEQVRRARGAGEETDKGLLSNRESVRLLSEELGARLPRAVSGAVAEMLPGINSIGGALLGAFAVAEIPKFIGAVKEATTALGGYTDEVRKAEKADIGASTSALIHFQTIAAGTILIAQTNQALANLAAKQGNWKEEAKAASAAMSDSKTLLTSLLGPLGSAITLYRGYKAAVKESSDTESQAAQLRQRLDAQLEQLGKLEVQQQKERTKAAKDAEQARKEAARAAQHSAGERVATEHRLAMEHVRAMQEAGRVVKQLQEDQEKENKAVYEYGQFMEKNAREEMAYLPFQRMNLQQVRQLIPAIEKEATATKHLSAARRELIGITQTLHQLEGNFSDAMHGEMTALEKMTDTAGDIGAQFAGLIGGTRASAAVKGAFDAALSIEYLAQFIASWGTDTAAGLASVQYGLAAAEMFKVAGTGGHHVSSAGGGYGGGNRPGLGRDHGNWSGGGDGMPPQTLAPGAVSQGGRFGQLRVLVMGEHQAGEWLAGTLNAAVKRGVSLVSTSSQRGAPVGH